MGRLSLILLLLPLGCFAQSFDGNSAWSGSFSEDSFDISASEATSGSCHISEYANGVDDAQGNNTDLPNEPSVTTQKVDFDISTQSAAFGNQTLFIRVICNVKAHYKFGENPTATSTDPYFTADVPEYMAVFPLLDQNKIALYGVD